ncbi:MAG: tRNA (adenosine(37)-N6)-threonylcarbamoyltransferase complex ATPase subunit type 1 TsaE [Chromatiales bacterium]
MNAASFHRVLASEAETEALGARLAACARPGRLLYLCGELGAGKTTLVRGFLRALGVRGAVKSPTYTLVEPYRVSGLDVYHFDFYRVNHPRELHEMGIGDYLRSDAMWLVEWPERGAGVLPEGDLQAVLRHGNAEGEREVSISVHSADGGAWLQEFLKDTTQLSHG